MDSVRIDGSFGEGGGQIVRSAVTLAAITGRTVEIDNIRKNRKVPGLRPQHMVGIGILAKICGAEVEGLHVNSTALRFSPSAGVDMILREDIGTAGSIPLVMQVLVPAVALIKRRLKISIVGGTDVPWSPTADYTKFVMARAFSAIGIEFRLDVKKRGYYPRGGGIVEAEIMPCASPRPVSLTKRTSKTAKLYCSFNGISAEAMRHEVGEAREVLERGGFEVEVAFKEEPALDRGCSILAFSHDDTSVIGSDIIYQKNMQGIGRTVASRFLEAGPGVDAFLSDMLVTPLSVVPETSVFRVKNITRHLETNLFVASEITGCRYGVGRIDGGFEVRIDGVSDSRMQ